MSASARAYPIQIATALPLRFIAGQKVVVHQIQTDEHGTVTATRRMLENGKILLEGRWNDLKPK